MKALLPGMLVLLLTACSQSTDSDSDLRNPAPIAREMYLQDISIASDGMADATEPRENQKLKVSFAPPQIAPSEAGKRLAPKIIRDGQMQIKCKKVAASKTYLDTLLKELNGFYERESLDNSAESITYNLIIKVPSVSFDSLLLYACSGKDVLEKKSIEARDVTEEYIDTETRLQNKKLVLARYRNLLAKSVTVKDILSVEENLRNLEEEIESKEGQLRYLDFQVAYSTLHLQLYEPKPFQYKPEENLGIKDRMLSSLADGWSRVVYSFLYLVGQWPWLIIISAAVWFIRRKWMAKRSIAQP